MGSRVYRALFFAGRQLSAGTSFADSCRRPGRRRHRYSPEAHQVARSHGELELLIDASQATEHGLADAADGLSPSEVLFDPLAHDLAQPIARMASGPPVDRASPATRVVGGDVRRNLALAARGLGSSISPNGAAASPRSLKTFKALPAPLRARSTCRYSRPDCLYSTPDTRAPHL